MYFLVSDETNLNSTEEIKFFVYGGLIIPYEVSDRISDEIDQIRTDCGYTGEDSLKFATRSRPKHVSTEQFNEAKKRVIEIAIQYNCEFIAYTAHHQIIKNANQASIIEKGADHVIGRFNKYLSDSNSFGFAFIDRLSNTGEYKFLTKKFTKGLEFSDGSQVELNRIKLFASTCDNASNFSSLVDIVLGAYRYLINNPKNTDLAEDLMQQIVSLLWHTRDGNRIITLEKGLIFRPLVVKVPAYKKEYEDLLEHLTSLLNKKRKTVANNGYKS